MSDYREVGHVVDGKGVREMLAVHHVDVSVVKNRKHKVRKWTLFHSTHTHNKHTRRTELLPHVALEVGTTR